MGSSAAEGINFGNGLEMDLRGEGFMGRVEMRVWGMGFGVSGLSERFE